MSHQSRLGYALGLALLAAACHGEPAREPAQTVVLPTAVADPEPAPEAPPRTTPPEPRKDPPSADDRARAESLFGEARALMNQGKYPEACQLFAESQALDPGIGTLLNLATCSERAGNTAEACAHFKAARDLAHEKGDSTREHFAAARVSKLGCP